MRSHLHLLTKQLRESNILPSLCVFNRDRPPLTAHLSSLATGAAPDTFPNDKKELWSQRGEGREHRDLSSAVCLFVFHFSLQVFALLFVMRYNESDMTSGTSSSVNNELVILARGCTQVGRMVHMSPEGRGGQTGPACSRTTSRTLC